VIAPKPAEVRARRGPKEPVDPRRPIAVLREQERRLDGTLVSTLTVLVAGAECPFTCVFCDLWRHTLDGPTPAGTIPAQLDRALEAEAPLPSPTWIKLYNASNWFDERAVPAVDDPAILARLAPFERVIVECHPRLVLQGGRAEHWARALGPGGLQVALGLETVHPEILPRLGKAASRDLFARAFDHLLELGATLRSFVLLGLPTLSRDEALEWALRSAEWAIGRGVEHVALIPLRSGNGTLEDLVEQGELALPDLATVEAAADRGLEIAGTRAVVTVDTWDLRTLPGACPACRARRLERLERQNLSGRREPPVDCGACRCR